MRQPYLYYIMYYQSVQFVLPLVQVCDASFFWQGVELVLAGMLPSFLHNLDVLRGRSMLYG